VGKMSAMGHPTKPTQPSIPPGSVNESSLMVTFVIHVITWITKVTIKRQIRGHGC